MLTQEITAKLDLLNTKLIDFSENKSLDKIKKLEKKVSQMEAYLERPDFEMFYETEDNALRNYLRKGDMSEFETKSFSSSAEEGGVLLRSTLYDKIITEITARSPVRKLASVETISTNALDVVIEDGDFSAGWVAEETERNETDTPKLQCKKIHLHELYAQPKATQRMLDDSAINLESWLVGRLQESFAKAENKSFLHGDGENQPVGILSYGREAIETINVAEEGKIDPIDILILINSLDDCFLANAHFIMHRSTLCEIQKLQDDNGRFVWQPSISDSHPQTLFGVPVVCSSDMPAFKSGNVAIILGDFKAAYKIVDRSGIAMMRDPYTEKPYVKFYAVKRVGGDLVNKNAIKFLRM